MSAPNMRLLAHVALGVSIGLATMLASPQQASAQTVLAVDVTPLTSVVNNVKDVVVGVLATVATLYLTLGGLRYLIAGGDPSQLQAAKSALRNAAIGYGMAALAPVLFSVLQQVVGK